MLAAILAILGVAFIGTIGIGAVGSLIKNRGKGGSSTSSSSSTSDDDKKKEPKKKKKNEREEEREAEREEEREEDIPFVRRKPKDDPVGADDVESEEEEKAPVKEKRTKAEFIQVAEMVRNQMITDTQEYYNMVDSHVKTMKLDPNTEEHRAIIAETMKRDWDSRVKGYNNYIDFCLGKITEENADEIFNEADKYFDEHYSLEGRLAFVTKPGGVVELASSKYRIYDEQIRSSGIYNFIERTGDSISPQVILPREHIAAITRKYLGDIVNGTTKKTDEFDRNLTEAIAGVKNEMSVADSLVSLYDDVFNQGERIADLEKFRVSAEKWIVSTDKTLQEMAEKLDFNALAQMLEDVESLKAKLEGIGEEETVLGKLQELEKNIGKAYAKKFEDIEKALQTSTKKIGDIEKEIVSLKNSLKAKVNSATMTSKMKALEKKVEELETRLTERLDKMAEEIASLTEKVDGNNKEVNKLLEEKLSEFLESDQGMLMFANNFAKMMKSKNPEVKKIVETAIIDKIKRYLNTKGGREKFDPIIINKINNVIVNNPEITNNIVDIVIQKIQEGQIIVGEGTERKEGDVYITVNGNVYGVNMKEVLEQAVESIVINGNVYDQSSGNQQGKGSKK